MSRKVFVNKSVTPPGGFLHAEHGVEFRHIVFDEVLRRVRSFRIANGFPLPPGWEVEVEDAMCAHYEPPVWVFETGGPSSTEPRAIRVADAINFLRVSAAWLKEGGSVVAQEEAERRASICHACPEQAVIAGCTPCTRFAELITNLTGGRTTTHDAGLLGCRVCSCSNKAQVHLPLDVLHKGVTPEMQFPDHCWKKL